MSGKHTFTPCSSWTGSGGYTQMYGIHVCQQMPLFLVTRPVSLNFANVIPAPIFLTHTLYYVLLVIPWWVELQRPTVVIVCVYK